MSNKKVIKPGATIGILGGGQLGRMMALAGRASGYRFVTLDPTEDCPCAQVCDKHVETGYDNVDGAMELAQASDVITYEFENVDANVAAVLEEKSYVPQGSELLRITQNRIREKSTLASYGIPVAPFCVIESEADAENAVKELGLPAVMKTATGGYDGKGQYVIRKLEEMAVAYRELSKAGTEIIIEQFIPFTVEISVIAARSVSGEVKTFPVAENVHRENILHLSIVPARIEQAVTERAEELAGAIAEKLQVVGLIAVEMFVTKDGEVLVNELAPRPHNSGHYTMDACVTSQFEQHIRAICDLPLGETGLLSPVVMVNILGEHLAPVLDKIEKLPPSAKLHLYGKKDSKPKRKMGHINVLAGAVEIALNEIEQLQIWEPMKEDM
ncbi:5-(carboxyamino)imidazole ribonucleotide synthase [Aneurinibacillus aneurinilyticus]|uniref:N5-carboxyaminoimidazole ribonucleotide synthase n=1 Tax=Aneurinibacillus aneurinilyticus ATCC 12856 TaxID=649747 RepID=U1X2A7_ANEAE|nr:5-(carboxyamino)imidazole ribonucleotide synthase [Aneurinibacillus aneurinilyticus]ERI08668.1 phosphoribosylaminoimidazole carboxylase, ATPase subunit [Aneurinibacillus aneurinilyticus ATCC 12856]MED0671266.1 5-(carboxyamino)imidazole ribonucleotide synthase [Aneurinibacillus aneurinilyticus]MED0708463.1 5-(carboxyamino)imidazole ribonucleotide synthase [Aneurinibacillus aneurinilyticus]MED0723217.1 5-(carboxyamino)imidazole ribonucleotide synthase [Aneurinibacillus aneurinilyticus]MED0732